MGQYERVHARSLVAAVDIPVGRFVNRAGGLGGPGVIGVSEHAARTGEVVSVVTGYSAAVQAAEMIAVGDFVDSDALGRAIVARAAGIGVAEGAAQAGFLFEMRCGFGALDPAALVTFERGPGGGGRILGRYEPITTRPRYPAGYTTAPARAPGVPIGTNAINASSVPGAGRTLAVDTTVKFNSQPTTRLQITGTPTAAYAQVETADATFALPAAAQEVRERTVLCAVRHNGLGAPKGATLYLGSATLSDYEAWGCQYVGDAGDWSIYQKQTAVGPSQIFGAGASQDLSSPRRARLRADTQANLIEGEMWFAEPYVLPAPTPTVIWTSDDGYAEWEWLGQEAAKRGLRLSFGVSEPYVGKPGFLTASQVIALQNTYGHEVTNHGGANDNYSTLGLTEYMRRVNSCRDYLIALGINRRTANLHQYIQGVSDEALRASMRDAGYLSARQTSSSYPVFPSAGVKLVGQHSDVLYNITTCASLGSGTTVDQVKTAITNTVKGGPAFIVGHRYASSASSTITWVNGYDSQFGTLNLMDWLAERRDVDGWRIMTWLEWYDDLFDSQLGVVV